MSGVFWKIQEILYLIGTEIIQIGPFKAEKIGFKDFNCHFKIMYRSSFYLKDVQQKQDAVF